MFIGDGVGGFVNIGESSDTTTPRTADVTCAFIDMRSMNESFESMVVYLKMVAYALFVMMTCMLVLIYSRYLRNRDVEFNLLNANGLRKKDITSLLGWDLFIQAVLFIVVTMGMVLIVCQWFKLSTVNVGSILLSVTAISFFVLLLPILISLHNIHKYSVARFLRT